MPVRRCVRETSLYCNQLMMSELCHFSQTFCALHVLVQDVNLGGRVVSMSASHQCGPGSIPGWGSDPDAVSEKGFVPL